MHIYNYLRRRLLPRVGTDPGTCAARYIISTGPGSAEVKTLPEKTYLGEAEECVVSVVAMLMQGRPL